MLDEKDLQAIQALFTANNEIILKQTKEMIDESEKRITKNMIALLDAEVTPKFNLLAEGQEIIVQRLDRIEERLEDMDAIDVRVTALEAMVKKLNRDVKNLQKAN